MTKQVRIENADTSDYKVVVEVWDKTEQGDVLAKTIELGHPTTLIAEYITSTRFLKVFERVEPKE